MPSRILRFEGFSVVPASAGQDGVTPVEGVQWDMELAVSHLATPIGRLIIASGDAGVCGLAFEDHEDALWPCLEARFGMLERRLERDDPPALERLRAYFEGDVAALDEIHTDAGGSTFQLQVWAALRRIPAGRTVSYRTLAGSIGRPTGSRAVATANATNPVAIAIPCHRVIHADGSISGYGGGVERKRWLLRHEAEHLPFRLTRC